MENQQLFRAITGRAQREPTGDVQPSTSRVNYAHPGASTPKKTAAKKAKTAKVGPKLGRGRPPKETAALRKEREAQEQEQQVSFLSAERADLEALLNKGSPQGIIPPGLRDLYDASAWGFTG